MPFTLAHPAAVLPLRRTKLVFSALIVGSMAPDYPYFVSLQDGIRWAHSWRGVFSFCLPAGLALLWLFHAVLKRPLVSLAPEFMRERISEEYLVFRFGPWRRFLLILGSLFLGTLTHILWDGLTHEHGLFVKHWQWLNGRVMLHHIVPMWKALQFLCSAAGLIVVLAMAVWWWTRKPLAVHAVRSNLSPRLRWFILGVAVVLACGAGAVGGYPLLHVNWRQALTPALIYGISAICAEAVVFSLAWHAVGLGQDKGKPLDSHVERLDVPAGR